MNIIKRIQQFISKYNESSLRQKELSVRIDIADKLRDIEEEFLNISRSQTAIIKVSSDIVKLQDKLANSYGKLNDKILTGMISLQLKQVELKALLKGNDE
jgi:hypothetical protein